MYILIPKDTTKKSKHKEVQLKVNKLRWNIKKYSNYPKEGRKRRMHIYAYMCIWTVLGTLTYYIDVCYYYHSPQEKRKATRNSRKSTQDSQDLNIKEINIWHYFLVTDGE